MFESTRRANSAFSGLSGLMGGSEGIYEMRLQMAMNPRARTIGEKWRLKPSSHLPPWRVGLKSTAIGSGLMGALLVGIWSFVDSAVFQNKKIEEAAVMAFENIILGGASGALGGMAAFAVAKFAARAIDRFGLVGRFGSYLVDFSSLAGGFIAGSVINYHGCSRLSHWFFS